MFQETNVGRKCTVCVSPHRSEIDRRLSESESLASIASRCDVSVSALSRHSNAHLSKQLRTLSGDTTAAPARLLARLIDMADSARDARLVARQTGSTAVQIRATDAEAKIVLALLGQLGIDDVEIVSLISDSSALVRAVASFVSNHAAGMELIAEIEKYEFRDTGFVDNLRALTR